MKKPINECTTVQEWQHSAPWPPTAEWTAKLGELCAQRIASAKAKCDELGVPCKQWATEYDGVNERGNHIWRSRINVGGGDLGIFCQRARRDGVNWHYMDRWSDSYRDVRICTEHRLTLTYCEGDISLVFCPTRQSYSAELRDAFQFYEKHKQNGL